MERLQQELKEVLNAENNIEKVIIINNQDERDFFESLVSEGRLHEVELSFGSINVFKDCGDYIKAKKLLLRELYDEIFDNIFLRFIKDEKENNLRFSDYSKELLEKHSGFNDYQGLIVDDIINKLKRIKYKGYMFEAEKLKDNDFELKKIFYAKFKAVIFARSNKPYVKINKLEGGFDLSIPNCRDFKVEDDRSIVCLYKNFDYLLDYNNISEDHVIVDEDSIKAFYGFDDTLFINPTEKWVNMWWDYDCPTLYKYYPNFDGTSNSWGLNLFCFRNLLIESSWNYTEVSDDITEEEVLIFTKDRQNTSIGKQAYLILKSRKTSEKEIKEKIDEVDNITLNIQELIDEHKDYIRTETLRKFVDDKSEDIREALNVEDGDEFIDDTLRELDGKMGMDCGFIYFAVREKRDLFKEVALLDKNEKHRYSNGSISLNLPFFVQSTTIKKVAGKIISELTRDKLGYTLDYWTVLD